MKTLRFQRAVFGIMRPVVARRLGLHPFLWVTSWRMLSPSLGDAEMMAALPADYF